MAHKDKVGPTLHGPWVIAWHYAIVHDDDSVELRRVEYDWQTAAREVRAKIGELPARRIEQSRFDVS